MGSHCWRLGGTPGELGGIAGEFLHQELVLVVVLPKRWFLSEAAVMDLGSEPSPVLPTLNLGIVGVGKYSKIKSNHQSNATIMGEIPAPRGQAQNEKKQPQTA